MSNSHYTQQWKNTCSFLKLDFPHIPCCLTGCSPLLCFRLFGRASTVQWMVMIRCGGSDTVLRAGAHRVWHQQQPVGLKHCGVVALYTGQPRVLHCPHCDQQGAAVLGHSRPAQRGRDGPPRVHRRLCCAWVHGQALLLISVTNVPAGEAPESIERHRWQRAGVQQQRRLCSGGRRRGQQGSAQALLLVQHL